MPQELANNNEVYSAKYQDPITPLPFFWYSHETPPLPLWYTHEKNKIIVWDTQKRHWIIVRLKSWEDLQLPEE